MRGDAEKAPAEGMLFLQTSSSSMNDLTETAMQSRMR